MDQRDYSIQRFRTRHIDLALREEEDWSDGRENHEETRSNPYAGTLSHGSASHVCGLATKGRSRSHCSQAVELRYRYEAGGMTLRDFTTAYQDLYIAYRKYLDRNPDEPFKEDLRLLVSSFDDARKF